MAEGDEMVPAENLLQPEQQSQASREHWEMPPGGSNPLDTQQTLCISPRNKILFIA